MNIDELNESSDQFNARILLKTPFGAEFGSELTERITFGRVTEEFLATVPCNEVGTDASGWEAKEMVSFWDGTGVRLGEVEPACAYHDGTPYEDGQSIGAALAELPNPGAVEWIVVRKEEFGEPSVFNGSLKLYRLNGGRFPVAEYLWSHHAPARARVNGALHIQYLDADGTALCLVPLTPKELEKYGKNIHCKGVTKRLFCEANFNGGALQAHWASDDRIQFHSGPFHSSEASDSAIDKYLARPGVRKIEDDGGPEPVFGSAVRAREAAKKSAA